MKEALNDQLVEDTEMVITSNGPDNRKIKMTGFPVKLSTHLHNYLGLRPS